MADWKQIPDTDVDPDAPVTSELMYALRDNPIAIAEGAAGAPRVRGFVGRFTVGAGGQGGMVGLGGFYGVQVFGKLSRGSAGTGFLSVRYSSDNGGSWGGWIQTLIDMNIVYADNPSDFSLSLPMKGAGMIDLSTREGIRGYPLAVPINEANGFQISFRVGSSAVSGYSIPMATGIGI